MPRARIHPVIATRHRPGALMAQLSRLVPQLLEGENIIVVFDGVERLPGGSFSSPTIKMIQIDGHIGVDRARRIGNAFVPSGTDDIVCEIDDHDLAEPTLLAELREAFRERTANIAYCDVVCTDPKHTVERVRKKQEGHFRTEGNLGFGMRAYRKWLYDAVGGYPLDYFPANDYALCCMIEQLCNYRGNVYIPKPLVKVVIDSRGISATHRTEQDREYARVMDAANNGGFRLPFRIPPPAAPRPGETVEPEPGPEAAPRGTSVAETKARGRPHVVLVTEVVGHGRGGGEMSMLGLLRRVAGKGYRVSALYATDAGERPYRSDWLALHKLDDLTLRDRGVGASDRFLMALDALRPDIVVTEVRTGANIADACKALGVPMLTLVQFWHNLVETSERGWDAVNRRPIPDDARNAWGCAKLKKSAAIVANSEFSAEVIRACLRREPDAIVYPPVNADAVRAKDAPPVHERPYIVCPSVQAGKGAEIFLALARRNPKMRFLLLAGDNRHSKEDDIVRAAREIGNVSVCEAWVRDMREIYAQARCVFIGTQTAESFCRTAAEARANGIPLLVSDAGNLARIVDERSGAVVPRRASLAEWEIGLRRALALRPRPTDEFCRDHTGRFVRVVDAHRRLSDVGIFVTPATGIRTGARQFEEVLGLRRLDWPACAETARDCALAILPGVWNPGLSDAIECKLGFWWCSHFAQMDTNRHEMRQLMDVVKTVRSRADRFLLLTCRTDVEVWRNVLGGRVKWLPNCLNVRAEGARGAEKLDGAHVFIPGPYVQRKNVYTALGAISAAGAEAHVTTRVEGCAAIKELARALKVRLHVHDCPEPADVLKVAGRCRAAVMVSTAETYCYAAAECVLAGAPTVGWRGIPILRGGPEQLAPADPTDVALVARSLREALKGGESLVERQREAVVRNAKCMNAAARRTILEVIHA